MLPKWAWSIAEQLLLHYDQLADSCGWLWIQFPTKVLSPDCKWLPRSEQDMSSLGHKQVKPVVKQEVFGYWKSVWTITKCFIYSGDLLSRSLWGPETRTTA